MKMQKNKTNAIAVVMLLILSTIATMAIVQPTSSHTPPWEIPTYAYIVAAPDPVGVGQRVSIGMWLSAVAHAHNLATTFAGTITN